MKAKIAQRIATHAQLEAEMRLARATPLLRAAREQRQAAPDLFSSTMGP